LVNESGLRSLKSSVSRARIASGKPVISDLFDISKETILITGASQGLGRRFAAILLLASGASRYMTGSVVTVDGGFLLN
jgi:NAD(P)-dependent dehydrogenase (short-subunit alcohol dehydrogenase family)